MYSVVIGDCISNMLLHDPANMKEHKNVSYFQSKKEGKDQESIQSSTTPDQRYQWENACLTAIPVVASSIPARSHIFVEIDHEIISTVILLPSADSFKKGCCQLQAKVCARITGYPLVRACPGKSVVWWTDHPAMTIAVDLGRKATNKQYQWERDNFTIKHHNESQEVSPFRADCHKALINWHTRKHNKNKTVIL